MWQNLNAKEMSYNAIFLSAFKTFIVFKLLLESPKTLEQISEILNEIPYIKSNLSKDTLRVYINTFRNAGCYVEKTLTKEKHREYAYFIPDNPFKPKISVNQAKRLFDIYDMILYNAPFRDILNLEMLINKFNNCFQDETFQNLYEEHSILKEFDIDLLNQLEQCCEEKSLVTVLYNSPRSGFKEIPIIAHQMKIQNYKLYLEGFGLEYKQEAIFLLNRIEKITNIVPSEDIKLPEECFFDIIFELYDSNIPLEDCEELLYENNGIRTIKHRTSNKVLTTQRFLQLANSCKILEPDDYKKEFIAQLKAMKEVYNYGN